jgi:CTP:molybdopterin cytidylyltransferase MocA
VAEHSSARRVVAEHAITFGSMRSAARSSLPRGASPGSGDSYVTETEHGAASVAAVVLAAGASSRFGSPKQLVRIDGRTMLERVVAKARLAELDPILAVTPSAGEVPEDVTRVPNDDPAAGMSLSLQLGIRALPAESDAALILLADQPMLPMATIDALLHQPTERPIVAARDEAGVLAPPVLIRRDAFGLAGQASGDAGLRSILAARPELVGTIDVREHGRDVDTRDDLAALGESCPGCGALLPPQPGGPTHEYIGASAACWMAFGELEAREFGEPGFGRLHRHTVDVYAVQHPGADGRRQRQSVAIHLIGLCHWLEHGLSATRLTPITQRLARDKRDWPWLEPPVAHDMTVIDVLPAADPAAHERLVRLWAESGWEAWSAHHQIVRTWAREAMLER